jgi:hypothetical protein
MRVPTPFVPCEVWSDGCPLWALVCGSMGLEPQSVCLPNSLWIEATQTWFPTTSLKVVSRRFLWRRRTPHVLLVDWCLLPPENHLFWDTTDTKLILYCGKPRRGFAVKGWFGWSRTVPHVVCGGVTDGSWVVGCYSRIPLAGHPEFPLRSRRPLLGILNSTTPGVALRSPPGSTALVSEVVYLRPTLLSPWGLLPVRTPARLPCVAAPGIPLYTRSGFVRRQLSGSELGTAWDFPIRWVELVGNDFLKTHFDDYRPRPPCKVLSLAGGAMISWWDRGGGEICFTSSGFGGS